MGPVSNYEQGQAAHRKGQRADDCPYFDSRSRWAWLEGWYGAERELRLCGGKVAADTRV